MNAEFNWWLLIVGLVVGAGLVWLVIADWSRREEDLTEDERAAEAGWIAEELRSRGERLDPSTAEEILDLHRAYLRQTAGVAGDEVGDGVVDDERAADGDLGSDGAVDLRAQEPPRASVRSARLNPRSGASPMESEPPA
jgi:hypothetical protein